MKVYIIVRNTEDEDFYDVHVFQCVCGTVEWADKRLADFKYNFPDDKFEILEREIE